MMIDDYMDAPEKGGYFWGNTLKGEYYSYVSHKKWDNITPSLGFEELQKEYSAKIEKKYGKAKEAVDWGWEKELGENKMVYTDDMGNKMFFGQSGTGHFDSLSFYIKLK